MPQKTNVHTADGATKVQAATRKLFSVDRAIPVKIKDVEEAVHIMLINMQAKFFQVYPQLVVEDTFLEALPSEDVGAIDRLDELLYLSGAANPLCQVFQDRVAPNVIDKDACHNIQNTKNCECDVQYEAETPDWTDFN